MSTRVPSSLHSSIPADATRTAVEATTPVAERARVRQAARNLVAAIAWLVIALYGLFLVATAEAAAMSAVTPATTTSALERYEAVIGIEIHCQLRTASKMFCSVFDRL